MKDEEGKKLVHMFTSPLTKAFGEHDEYERPPRGLFPQLENWFPPFHWTSNTKQFSARLFHAHIKH